MAAYFAKKRRAKARESQRHRVNTCASGPKPLNLNAPKDVPLTVRSCHSYASKYPQGSGVPPHKHSFVRCSSALHATRQNTSRRSALGARCVCLVGEKPDVLLPGIVGMRGSMVVRLRPRMDIEYTPPLRPYLRLEGGEGVQMCP